MQLYETKVNKDFLRATSQTKSVKDYSTIRTMSMYQILSNNLRILNLSSPNLELWIQITKVILR